jgi:hypothetical protein
MIPRIIAICGSKRHGKDTIANYLSSNYDYEHVKISQKMKDVCKILFGFSNNQMETDDKEIIDPKWNITPRKAMQFIGTEVGQFKIQELLPIIDRKFWINSLLKELNPNKKYVISDLRFLHEFEEIKRLDGLIIRVERPNLILPTDLHISESEYINIPTNIIIKNDNIENLYLQLNNLMNSFKFNFTLSRS